MRSLRAQVTSSRAIQKLLSFLTVTFVYQIPERGKIRGAVHHLSQAGGLLPGVLTENVQKTGKYPLLLQQKLLGCLSAEQRGSMFVIACELLAMAE
ncbi:hypothetical protein CDAR_250661 [Caerostris darwini]|uniref:Uncharacterized protein n=1 Tax=Caerostris darwini TaxID=1538125 RepID=A0AAV4RPM2_9ARAC|nr:hypothetical protein CDAR_250661 [Caerostris darwini]